MRITAAIDRVYMFYPQWGERAKFSLMLGSYVTRQGDAFIHKTAFNIPSLLLKDWQYFGQTATQTSEQTSGETLQILRLWQNRITGEVKRAEEPPPLELIPKANFQGFEVGGIPQIRQKLFSDSSQIITFIDVDYNFNTNISRGTIIYGNE